LWFFKKESSYPTSNHRVSQILSIKKSDAALCAVMPWGRALPELAWAPYSGNSLPLRPYLPHELQYNEVVINQKFIRNVDFKHRN
jgi:hypothetical protein